MMVLHSNKKSHHHAMMKKTIPPHLRCHHAAKADV